MLSAAEILVLRAVMAATTAIAITPRTTAYSAIVWPASSRSVDRRSKSSWIKGFTSSTNVRAALATACALVFGTGGGALEGLDPIPPFRGTWPGPPASVGADGDHHRRARDRARGASRGGEGRRRAGRRRRPPARPGDGAGGRRPGLAHLRAHEARGMRR